MEGKKESGLGRGQSRASIQCHLRPQPTLRGSFETRMVLQNCLELMQGRQASSVRARALFSQGQFPPQLPPILQGLLEHVVQMARPLVLQPGPTADPTQSWRYLGSPNIPTGAALPDVKYDPSKPNRDYLVLGFLLCDGSCEMQ